jgi:hypothetical protein
MIAPSTRLFGLLMEDPRTDGHVARLYNYLFGFNGLDAAYLTFLLNAKQLDFTLTGFDATGQTSEVHVVPAHQAAAARWLGQEGRVDRLVFRPTRAGALVHPDAATWLQVDAVCARALADAERWFGRPLEAPPDWRDVVGEKTFRPCKLTHDTFGRTA